MKRLAKTACGLLFLASACAHEAAPPKAPRTTSATTASRPRALTAYCARQLSTLATGAPLSEAAAAEWAARSVHEPGVTSRLIDDLLGSEGFLERVGPAVAVGAGALSKGLEPVSTRFVLHRDTSEGAPRYFLNERCANKDAVTVTPWWTSEPVRVCADAVRPETFRVGSGYCDGVANVGLARGKDKCGCGPNLMRCFPSEERMNAVLDGLVGEVRATVRYVIENELPLRAAYLGNATVRGRDAELVYQRWIAEAKQTAPALDAVRAWPAEGALRPRPELAPGQHAGILTAPATIFRNTGMRANVRDFSSGLWCVEPGSLNVSTDVVLGLKAADTRAGEGWRELAAKPGCNACHARLDYGSQFFRGYTDIRTGEHFIPELHQAGHRGEVFLRDADDMRGRYELTPRSFAEVATAQPEFPACFARRAASAIFGRDAGEPERSAIREEFDKTGRVRPAMRRGLLAFAERCGDDEARPPESPEVSLPAEATKGEPLAAPPAPSGPDVPPPERLASQLRQSCQSCHGFADAPALARVQLRAMLDRVASGTMPARPTTMTPTTRAALVHTLVEATWQREADRELAVRYYDGVLASARPSHGAPAATMDGYRPEVAFRVIRQAAGAEKGFSWPEGYFNEGGGFTPGLTTAMGLEALAACKTGARAGAPLDDCLDRATDPFALSRAPLKAVTLPSASRSAPGVDPVHLRKAR